MTELASPTAVQPFTPEKFLDVARVPETPRTKGYAGRVFVLGSWASRVTVYDQQIRALNLVDALDRVAETGPLSDRKVAVIGGGIAGLTAAAAAATLGAQVVVFEESPHTMPLQRHCTRRWIHPRVLDWPDPGALCPHANLPLLSWSADYAHRVVQQIDDAWWRVSRCARHASLVLKNARNLTMEPCGTNDSPILINWKNETRVDTESGLSAFIRDDRTKLCESGTRQWRCEFAILAVGFGIERRLVNGNVEVGQSYWADDDLDFDVESKRTWLVSGAGDGALTDLMRLCIHDFKHQEILRAFTEKKFYEDARRAVETVEAEAKRAENCKDALHRGYLDLRVNSAIEFFSQRRRDLKVTWRTGDPVFFRESTQKLNRFIVSQLLALENSPINMVTKKTALKGGNSNEIEISGNEQSTFHQIVVRHGPESPIKSRFGDVWEAFTENDQWKRTLDDSNRSRLPGWDAGRFDLDKATIPAKSSQDRSWCTVLLAGANPDEPGLRDSVSAAIGRNRESLRALVAEVAPPRFMRITDCLASTDAYVEAVRSLCASEAVIVDVTDYQPGIMLLLGIRAVARRGVTICVITRQLDAQEWSRLPFNLKEINPSSVAGNNDGSLHALLVDGLNQLQNSESYLDLPAYELIRQASEPLQIEALALCSFRPDYIRAQWRYLCDNLKPQFTRIIDLGSSRLVSYRLYNAIRHAPRCLVDWTHWSPNVFFEFGVRVAACPTGHVSICDAQTMQAPYIGTQLRQLRDLFGVLEYDANHDDKDRLRAIQHWVFGALEKSMAPSTYELVRDSLNLANEPGGKPVFQELRDAAGTLVGKGGQMSARSLLFAAKNREFLRQTREAAIDYVMAAWYLLRSKNRRGEDVTDALRKVESEIDELIDNYKPDLQDFWKQEKAR